MKALSPPQGASINGVPLRPSRRYIRNPDLLFPLFGFTNLADSRTELGLSGTRPPPPSPSPPLPEHTSLPLPGFYEDVRFSFSWADFAAAADTVAAAPLPSPAAFLHSYRPASAE